MKKHTTDAELPISPSEQPKSSTRRKILIGIGATGAIAIGGGAFALRNLRRSLANFGAESQGEAKVPNEVMMWCEISPDNKMTLFIPKTEMGQGVHTALAQIFADELGADWNTITVVQADTKRGFDPGQTMFSNGSTSVMSLYLPTRKAAARLRSALATEAAQMLGVEVNQIELSESRCSIKNSNTSSSSPPQTLTFGKIIAEKKGTWAIPKEAALKPNSEFTLIGKNVPRADLEAKLTGKAVYGYDARVPGMLFGAVARPPRHGAVLKSASAGEAATMPGVIKVVIQEGFAGVVATSRTKARAAAKKIKTEWQGGATLSSADITRMTKIPTGAVGQVVQEIGDTDGNLPKDCFQAEYSTPLAAHAHLEPQAGLVDIKPDGSVVVYASTQGPGITRLAVARALDIDSEKITVIPCYMGGGFGRKAGFDAPKEAAILAKACGKPVHVGWTREEELRYGFYRPPTHQRLRASVDKNGKIQAFEHFISSGDVLLSAGGMVWGNTGAIIAETLATVIGTDPGILPGAAFLYDVPHAQVLSRRVELPILTGAWRGLGLLANMYARESFIDELAHANKFDTIEFRLKNLADDELGKRVKAALKRAAEKSDWSKPAEQGRARGVALCFSAGTVVVQVAEVSIKDGNINVHKVHAVVDAGLVISPNGAAAQTQGAIAMGLSSTLIENVVFKDGLAEASNFDGYPLLTLSQTPNIEVEFIGGGDEPFGMGEPPIGPIAAAIANAVFVLTGKRLRDLPLKFEEKVS
jgi:isoquinoline 1-oxidoreductase beta subunit